MKIVPHAPLSPEWFAYREKRITGSTVAAILGVQNNPRSEYARSPLSEWARITGRLVKREEARSPYADFGILTEDAHREWISQDNPSGWIDSTPYIVGHPMYDWACCSPDGLATDGETRVLLELKAPSPWTAAEWDERLPLAYQVQLQWNMMCCDCSSGLLSVILPPKESTTALVALVCALMRAPIWDGTADGPLLSSLKDAGWTRRDYLLDADREFQAMLNERVSEWWALHIEQDVQPDASGLACDKSALGDINAGKEPDLDFDETVVAQVTALEAFQSEINARKADVERLKNILTQKAGAASWMDAKKAINRARKEVG